MSDFIQGNDCLFQIDIGSGYASVLCAKSFTVNIETEEQETTTSGDGQYKDYDYRVLSYTLNINSGMKIQDNVNPVVFDFVDAQKNFLEVPFRIIWKDITNAVKVFRGRAIIKTSNLLSSAAQTADGTIDLIGKGEFFLENALPNMRNVRILITGNAPIVALIHFKLLNADGDIILDSALLPGASGGDLSNPNDVTTQVEAGQYYYWWQVDTNSEENLFMLSAPGALDQPFIDGITVKQSYPTVAYDFTADRTVTFQLSSYVPPPTCVPPAVVGSPALPDGTVGTFYTFSFPITGSAPFNINNVTKPSWMTISEADTGPGTFAILITGTPDVSGSNITVSFDIVNACGTVSYSDTIDVAAAAGPSTISWSYTNSAFGGGTLRIYVNSILIVQAAFINGAFQSGSFTVNPGDVVQSTISGTTSNHKHLTVTDSVSGTLFDQDNFSNPTYTFTDVNAHNYTITANIH